MSSRIRKDIPIDPSTPRTADSGGELAKILDAHFKGQIRIKLSRNLINLWRKGDVPPGCPPPPEPVNGRHQVFLWIEWVHTYILPTRRLGDKPDGDANDPEVDYAELMRRGEIAVAKKRIENAETAKIEREVLEGARQSVESFYRNVRMLGSIMNHSITQFFEKGTASELIQFGRTLSLTEAQANQFELEVRLACQRAADALRSRLAAELMKAEIVAENP